MGSDGLLDDDFDELVARSLRRDRAAFGALVTRLSRFVGSIVRQDVRDEHDADEVANDVFVQVWYGLPKLDEVASFRSWLLAVTVRRILMYHRARKTAKRRLERTGGPAPEVADGSSVLDDALLAEIRERVRAELDRLPPEQARLIDERYFRELTLREIAEPRALTIDQTYRRIGRVLDNLGSRLRGTPDPRRRRRDADD